MYHTTFKKLEAVWSEVSGKEVGTSRWACGDCNTPIPHDEVDVILVDKDGIASDTPNELIGVSFSVSRACPTCGKKSDKIFYYTLDKNIIKAVVKIAHKTDWNNKFDRLFAVASAYNSLLFRLKLEEEKKKAA